jgi:acyl-CoA synthetase (NDP forming)
MVKSAREKSVRGLFTPSAVTLIGGSERSVTTLRFLANLQRTDLLSRLPITVVNPHGADLPGVDVVSSVTELEGPPGLVVLMLPGDRCLQALQELADSPTALPTGVIVYSGGIEAPVGGPSLQDWSRTTLVPVIGPASMGFVHPSHGLAATSVVIPETPISGPVSLVSQSGGVLSGVIRWLIQRRIGFRTAVGYGNGTCLGLGELGTSLLADEGTEILAVYAESVASIAEFRDLARSAQISGKTLVVTLPGTSQRGERLGASHVGEIGTSRRVLEGVARQFGGIVVSSLEDMLSSLEGLAHVDRTWTGSQGGVGVMAASGGVAVLLADAGEQVGLTFPDISDSTARALQRRRPREVSNPFDSSAGMSKSDRFDQDVLDFAGDPSLGVVAYVVGTGLPADVIPLHVAKATEFVARVRQLGKIPLLSEAVGLSRADLLDMPGVPMGSGIRDTALKLLAVGAWAEGRSAVGNSRAEPGSRQRPTMRLAAQIDEGTIYTGIDARKALAALPVSWPRVLYLTDTSDRDQIVDQVGGEFGYPVVLKSEAGLAHRATEGGLLTGVRSPRSLRAGLDYLVSRFGMPISINEYVEHDVELLVGFERRLGDLPVFAFGVGGSQAGTGVRFAAVPMTADEAVGLVRNDVPTARQNQIVELILAMQDLVLGDDRIAALELNPVTWAADASLVALDAKIHGATG